MTLGTILVAIGPEDTDRSDEIIETFLEVAKPADATVVLAHIFMDEEYNQRLSQLEFDTSREAINPDQVAERYTVMQDLRPTLDAAGLEYEIRGAVGEQGPKIVDVATETDADRVIVAGRNRSPVGKAVFGSTAQGVLLSSPCPVTFVCLN
ncbi:universal stress protein (plasmid) [Natrinema zhouii]|uniref:universal stress protein n=1 Tax=Natrinema zhouii TaxID=1710539 RepID=UPI001CFFDF8C|nr:universal stress protein [Natrinema zhouii]UHQ98488.1 universal stress protein [Natrinema zhouii]